MRAALGAAALVGGLVAGPAAADVTYVEVPGGVAALLRAGGIGDGAVTANEPGDVLVRARDGAHFRLVLGNGAPQLVAVALLRRQAAAADMLPDGEVTYGRRDIRRAWLAQPTTRYRHGILGDAIEAAELRVQRFDGRIFRYVLDAGSVFEDRRARLVDLDGDDFDEIVVVQSYLDQGAALSVFRVGANAIEYVAEVPAIGRPNRWLNPAGVADFDGDGRTEIAFVETPHIGGSLIVYEYAARRLTREQRVRGFSNHAIGAREQDMAAVVDWNSDGVADLALPDAARRAMRVVTFAAGRFRDLATLSHGQAIVTAVLSVATGGRARIVYGLADGRLVVASP